MMGLDLNDLTPSPQSSYNSSFGSESGRKLINSSNTSITALVPGSVVTTQNISTVIRPKGNNNSLQFVKIQTPELSKKAVEQIKLVEDSKISKEKIKEVEEDWQNNLLNWKSKRRQQFNFAVDHEPNNPFDTSVDSNGGRKIKTFAEMIEQRAKSGNRLGFHLQRYIGADDEEDNTLPTTQDTTKDCTDGEAEQSPNKFDCDVESDSGDQSDQEEVDKKQELEVRQAREDVKEKQEVELDEENQEQDGEGEQDESEEEEDQDEEQKHLQRIAFEAKLKAFEKLTKPTPPPARKLVPNRIARNSIAPTSRPKTDIAPAERKQQQQYQQPQPQPKPQLPTPSKVAESSHPKFDEINHHPKTNEQQQSPSETLTTPTKPMVKDDDRLHSTPNRSTSSSSIQIDKSLSQISIDNSIQRVQDSFKQLNIVQKPVPKPPPEPSSKTLVTIPNNNNNNNSSSNNKSFNQVTNIVQKPRSIVSQPLPESPKSVTSQRRLTREDKDRTVLSVSGKKRCSSCKEELGRGAAAFVVESLCLVYHTNCFRCSVCHVNLSNGFQGVDVRVHAGALHCQNCYSKDGLNYSRV